MLDETTYIKKDNEISQEEAREFLKQISLDLEERGYDSIKQMAGYLISGDPGYISSYKNCRNRITEIDRTSIVEELLDNYLK